MHIVGTDLVLRQKADIDFMKDTFEKWKETTHSRPEGARTENQNNPVAWESSKALRRGSVEAAKAAGRKAEEKK